MATVNGVYYPEGSDTYDLPADLKEHAETDALQALDAAAAALAEANLYTDEQIASGAIPVLGTMPNGTDMNTLRDTGVWRSPATVGGIASITNRPPGGYTDGGVYRQFITLVLTAGPITFQIARAWLDGNTMTEFTRTANGTNFSPWKEAGSDRMPRFGTMPNGTDLNDLRASGTHDSPATVGGITSILNRPPGGYTDGGIFRQFSLDVRAVGPVTFQTAYAWLDGNTMEVFTRTANGTNFSPWRTVRDEMAEPIIRSVVGTPDRGGNLAKLRTGVLNPAVRTVVVAVGVSHFRTQGGGRINAIERMAYAAGSPTVPNLDSLPATPGAGMQWINGSVGGSESANYLPEARCAKIDLANPDYVIHGIGANDYSRNVTPGQFEARVRNRLVRIESGTPGVVNVLVHLQNRSDASSPDYPWSDYGNVLRALAEEHPDRVFVDANAPMDSLRLHKRVVGPGAVTSFGLQLGDNIHLTDNGVKVLARVMSDALGIPSPPDVGPELREATFPASDTYTASTDLAAVTLPALAYPRMVTVRAVAAYRASGTGSATFTAGPAGAPAAAPLRGDDIDTGVEVTRDFYLPPATEGTYTAAVQVTGTASVFISGDPGASLLQVTERPY